MNAAGKHKQWRNVPLLSAAEFLKQFSPDVSVGQPTRQSERGRDARRLLFTYSIRNWTWGLTKIMQQNCPPIKSVPNTIIAHIMCMKKQQEAVCCLCCCLTVMQNYFSRVGSRKPLSSQLYNIPPSMFAITMVNEKLALPHSNGIEGVTVFYQNELHIQKHRLHISVLETCRIKVPILSENCSKSRKTSNSIT